MTTTDVRIILCMLNDFEKVLRRIVGVGGTESLSGIDAFALSETPGDDDTTRLARANGAFLLSLCGGPEAETATTVLEDAGGPRIVAGRIPAAAQAMGAGRAAGTGRTHSDAARKRQEAAAWADQPTNSHWDRTAQKAVWGFLFPEGASCLDDPDRAVRTLRERRTIRVDQLNPQPIDDPISEMLITSQHSPDTAVGPLGDR